MHKTIIKYSLFSKMLNLLLCCAILVAASCFVVDFHNTLAYGGIDLRNRVVGARVLATGRDPYFFKWHTGLPQAWLDPLDDAFPATRVTVTPTVLLLHTFMAPLPYATQRLLWFFLQWALFIGTVLLAAACATTTWQKKGIWCLALLAIAGSFFWRMHLERGQIYILYSFLIVLACWYFRKGKYQPQFISGLFLGLTISLRPTMIMLGFPMLLSKQWKVIVGISLGLLVGIGSTVLTFGIQPWQSYYRAMTLWSQRAPDGVADALPDLTKGSPPSIDGMTNLLTKHHVATTDTALASVTLPYGRHIPSVLLLIVFISGLVCLLWYLNRTRRINPINYSVFLIGIYSTYVIDFFLPTKRYTYEDILWLPLLAFIMIQFGISRILASWTAILLVSGLLLSATIPSVLQSYHLPLSEILIASYGLLMLLHLPQSPPLLITASDNS